MHLCPVAQITGIDVYANVAANLGPPVVMGYEFEGLEVACMSSNVCIVVLFDDMTPQVSVFGDIDLTTEHE
jgi:hypothetical protein